MGAKSAADSTYEELDKPIDMPSTNLGNKILKREASPEEITKYKKKGISPYLVPDNPQINDALPSLSQILSQEGF